MPWERDAALLALLPPRQSQYSFDHLSQAETEAFEAALGDGFGDVWARDYHPMPAPLGFELAYSSTGIL